MLGHLSHRTKRPIYKTKGNILKKRIVHISALQAAKVSALLYLVISIPIVALMALGSMTSSTPNKIPIFILVLMPILYMVVGFIFSAISAWIYNLIAKWVGGIEYTTVELP